MVGRKQNVAGSNLVSPTKTVGNKGVLDGLKNPFSDFRYKTVQIWNDLLDVSPPACGAEHLDRVRATVQILRPQRRVRTKVIVVLHGDTET